MLSNLKRLQLATNLSAGVDSSSNFDSNSMFSIFSLSIQLSESGLANWVAVVFHLCRYIDLLKSDGIQEWVFQELKQIAQVSFGMHTYIHTYIHTLKDTVQYLYRLR